MAPYEEESTRSFRYSYREESKRNSNAVKGSPASNRYTGALMQDNADQSAELARIAWGYLNDSMRTPLCCHMLRRI